MTDKELATNAWIELMATTDSYPKWALKGFPINTHWSKAKSYLDQIGLSSTPTPTPTPTPTGMRIVSVPSYAITSKVITSTAEFLSAIQSMIGGELICRGPFVIPASNQLTFSRDYGNLSVWFENGARFEGLPRGNPEFAGAYFKGAKNISLYGMDVQNEAGYGIIVEDSTNVRIWNGNVHHVGGTCFFTTNHLADSILDIDLELSECGLAVTLGYNIAIDPHAEKGTGVHPCYIGGTPDSNSSFFAKGLFSLRMHDCDTGSGQIGSNIKDAQFWVEGNRLNKKAISQVAGNVLQFWGKNVNNIVVHYVYGEDCQGRVVDTNALTIDNTITVKIARGLRCCLNLNLNEPIPQDEYFDTRHAVAYLDKQKLG